jgi:hypothetical protein
LSANPTSSGSSSEAPATPPAGGPPPGSQVVPVDDSSAEAKYSNFARVIGTPEEVIVDFGLNPQPMGMPDKPIQITQRLVLNYFTAKRLLAALSMTVQRHEGAFGVLETDVGKRVRQR